jgi:hypothetical protein
MGSLLQQFARDLGDALNPDHPRPFQTPHRDQGETAHPLVVSFLWIDIESLCLSSSRSVPPQVVIAGSAPVTIWSQSRH